MNRNRRLGLALAVCAVVMSVLLGASAAQAAQVQPPGGTNATGITNLQVGTTRYNVVFVSKSGTELYSNDCAGTAPCFDFTTQTAAEEARQAVVNALNTSSAETVGPANQDLFYIGYAFNGSDTNVASGQFSSTATFWQNAASTSLSSAATTTYADFSVVPIPAAAWLLGSGLVALGAVARRRKQTA